MPFFDLKKYKEEKAKRRQARTRPPTTDELRWSKKLYAALKRTRRLQGPYSRDGWAKTIGTLVQEKKDWDPVPVEIVDKVLDWYVKRIGEQNVPRVWSAKSFVYRFGHLWDLADQDLGPTVPKISKAAKQIVSRITGYGFYGWPEVSLQQLPAVVQLSLDAYSTFYEQASAKIKTNIGKCKRTGGLRNEFLEHKNRQTRAMGRFCDKLGGKPCGGYSQRGIGLPEPETFVERWFIDVYAQRTEWKNWDGKLWREVWSLNHERFQRGMIEWSRNNGSVELWHQFLESVDEG